MDKQDLTRFNAVTGTDSDIDLNDLNEHLELGMALLDGQLVDLKKAGMLDKSKKAELVIETTRNLILMQIIGIDLLTEKMQEVEALAAKIDLIQTNLENFKKNGFGG